MEITQSNNFKYSNVETSGFLRSKQLENNDLQPVQNRINMDRVEYSNSNQNSLTLQLSASIQRVSNIQMVQGDVSKALKIVNEFEKTVVENGSSLDSIQPQIQNFISNFNSSTQGLNDNISKIVEEKGSDDSRVYFDGILGSKPISGQEIYEAITQQKQKLQQFSKELDYQLEQSSNQAKEMFSMERSQSAVTQQSISIDFEQESISFEAKTVQTQNGSITDTQANAAPSATKELLIAS